VGGVLGLLTLAALAAVTVQAIRWLGFAIRQALDPTRDNLRSRPDRLPPLNGDDLEGGAGVRAPRPRGRPPGLSAAALTLEADEETAFVPERIVLARPPDWPRAESA